MKQGFSHGPGPICRIWHVIFMILCSLEGEVWWSALVVSWHTTRSPTINSDTGEQGGGLMPRPMGRGWELNISCQESELFEG